MGTFDKLSIGIYVAYVVNKRKKMCTVGQVQNCSHLGNRKRWSLGRAMHLKRP